MPRWRHAVPEPKGNRGSLPRPSLRASTRGPASGGMYPLASVPDRPSRGPGGILPDTRVLLLGNASSDGLARALTRSGRILTRTVLPEETVSLGSTNDVIVIDAVPPPTTVADVCRDIR